MNDTVISQFTILKKRPDYSYLDSAASSLTPDSVLGVMNEYYMQYRSNIHRGVYTDSEKASRAYEDVRKQTAQFFGAEQNEIFFTSGTTDGINKLAYGLEHLVTKDGVIVLTELEHHANLVPWQELAKRTGAKLRFIPVNKETFELDENLEQYFDAQVKIVSIAHVSNTLGTIQPIEKISKLAHEVGAVVAISSDACDRAVCGRRGADRRSETIVSTPAGRPFSAQTPCPSALCATLLVQKRGAGIQSRAL